MQSYYKKIKEINREKNGRQRILTRKKKKVSIEQIKIWVKHIAINLKTKN